MTTMRIALLAIVFVGCGPQQQCPLVDEHHIELDEVGPGGFTAEDLLAFVGTERVYDVGPVPYSTVPIGITGPITATIGDVQGRPTVRDQSCTPAILFVLAAVRVTSDDGTLDVAGEVELGGSDLMDIAVAWDMWPAGPLQGTVPSWMVDAAASEQSDNCPEHADEDPAIQVFLGGALATSVLRFDAQYAHHGACGYTATLASASLTPL